MIRIQIDRRNNEEVQNAEGADESNVFQTQTIGFLSLGSMIKIECVRPSMSSEDDPSPKIAISFHNNELSMFRVYVVNM